MNRTRIARRAARIGAAGENYLLTHTDLRGQVRSLQYTAGSLFIPGRIDASLRLWARDRVFQLRKFWFGDRFSSPASVACRAALRAVSGRGVDALAHRAQFMPGYYVVLAAARRGVTQC